MPKVRGKWRFVFLDFSPKAEDLDEIKSEGAHAYQWSEMYRGREVVEVADHEVPIEELRKQLEAAVAAISYQSRVRSEMLRQLEVAQRRLLRELSVLAESVDPERGGGH